MDRDEQTSLDSFMRLVENGERRVYLEYPATRDVLIKLFSPIAAGFCLTLVLVSIYAFIGPVLNPILTLVSIFLPIIVGLVLPFRGIARTSRKVEQFGVRGIPRPRLSEAISFLDMLSEGVADAGKIVDEKKPEEYNITSSMALGTTLQVLNKIDPGLGSRWLQTLSTRLSEEISTRLKIFLRVTILGTLAIVFLAIALQILVMLRLIDSMFFLQVLIVSAVVAIILVASLSIYALRNQNANPPARVEEAVRGPEIRTETAYVLDHLLTTVIEEGEYPLRILVLGNYDELRYTGRTYMTSREMVLREAVLIPRAARLSLTS